MGTRGFIGFVVGEQEKITYNHWDSYPEGLGSTFLKAVRRWMSTGESEHRINQSRELVLVTDEMKPTPEQIEALRKYADTHVDDGRLDNWYVLLRHTQGDPDAILDAGYAADASNFPRDSLFCEWGYLVDWDKRVLEVYEGFQQDRPDAGRWKGQDGLDMDKQAELHGTPYYPVTLRATFPLEALPELEVFVEKVRQASIDGEREAV